MELEMALLDYLAQMTRNNVNGLLPRAGGHHSRWRLATLAARC